MDRAVNDATLKKMGDIFQYYIALRDCFKMGMSDILQIEVNGDVSVIAELSKDSFQKETSFGKKETWRPRCGFLENFIQLVYTI